MRKRLLVLLAAVLPVAVIIGIVASRGDTQRARPKLPIGTGPAREAAALGAPAAGAPAATAIAPLQSFRYEAGAELPALGGEAAAYKLVPRPERERALEDALGQDVQVDPASGSWSTSSAVSSSGVAVACAPDASCDDVPKIVPAPPANLPSPDEARARAAAVFAAAGLDVERAEVKVDVQVAQTVVAAFWLLDGLEPEEPAASVVFGGDGVTYASGYVADVERLDRYPLIDTRQAIDRLNAGEAGWGRPEPLIAMDQAAPLVLTGVRLALAIAPGYDGTTYLVPVYAFTADTGPAASALAIDRSFFGEPPAASDVVGKGGGADGASGATGGTGTGTAVPGSPGEVAPAPAPAPVPETFEVTPSS